MVKDIEKKNELIDLVLFSKIFSNQSRYFKKIKERFSSLEEYMVLDCIASHNISNLVEAIKSHNSSSGIDLFIEQFWNNLKLKKNSGVSIHGISRDTNIPRTTVKRMSDNLIKKKLIIKNIDGYLVPTGLIHIYCKELRNIISKNQIEFVNFYNSLNVNNLST